MTIQNDGPRLVTVTGRGPFGGWTFQEVQGFWANPQNDKGMVLAEGQQYVVTLRTKEHPGINPNTGKPYNPYQDIVTAEQADPENVPEGFETAFTPQGQEVVQPSGQQASVADYDAEHPEAGPVRASFANMRDPTRESIEKQVVAKEFGAMLIALLGEEVNELSPDTESNPIFSASQIEYMRGVWFDLCYELQHGHPPPPQQAEEA